MKKQSNVLIALGLSVAISTSAIADCGCSDNNARHKFYIGGEGGISAPVKRKFEEKLSVDKSLKCKGNLSNSSMYGVLMGYRFYEGMALEGAFQRKPLYKLRVTTPQVMLTNVPIAQVPGLVLPSVTVPSGQSTVKVGSDLYLLGLVYDLQGFGSATPYVGIDAGIARIKNTAADIYSNVTVLGVTTATKVMRINKGSCTSPVLQFNLGVTSKEILPRVQLYAAARFQVIKDIKLKYQTINPSTNVITPGKFKKTLGIGEVVVGLTYDLF